MVVMLVECNTMLLKGNMLGGGVMLKLFKGRT